MGNQLGRREFLKMAGAAAGATAAAAATSGRIFAAGSTGSLPQQDATPEATATDLAYWEVMDLHHEEGVNIYLANIGTDPTFWGNKLDYEMDGDTKVFRLVCQEIDWDTGGGMIFPAMAYNGTVPGPEIRVTEGDKLRIIVRNEMSQSTAIHPHGVLLPNSQDGVPYITQPPITPGSEFTYEFVAPNPGTHMYHTHHNSAEQITRGLLGPLVIEPLDKSREPVVSAEYNFVLNDSALGFTINGKGFPYTQPILAKMGDKIRVRYYNEGLMIHPMHLHGIPQTVFMKDGFYLPVPYMVDTLNIAPGERYDVLIDCNNPGVWAYHCHILSHAEGPDGMFGMVTALVVQE
jgi:FtsP/CotA-like multicopper oxidase with cupredoxin domain